VYSVTAGGIFDGAQKNKHRSLSAFNPVYNDVIIDVNANGADRGKKDQRQRWLRQR